jgi:hypothetical protein
MKKLAELISSGTFGLQEALNDASASGGGTVTVDTSTGFTRNLFGSTGPAASTIYTVIYTCQ